jgi:DNA replication protein DnaC
MKECPLCGGSGWRPMERGGLRAVEVCDCRKKRDENWWMDRAAIPRRHRPCDLEDFNAPNDSLRFAKIKARGFVENYPSVKEGLLFLGNPGVGKTHLAVAILKQLMFQRRVDSLFCSYQDLFQRIRESYDPVSALTESEVLGPILNTELLLIDDLGANRFSEWSEDTITYVLNHRYNQKKATILTSNLPDLPPNTVEDRRERTPGGRYRMVDTLTDRIGLRVRSRLYEMCDVVTILADDFRQTVRAHQE